MAWVAVGLARNTNTMIRMILMLVNRLRECEGVQIEKGQSTEHQEGGHGIQFAGGMGSLE